MKVSRKLFATLVLSFAAIALSGCDPWYHFHHEDRTGYCAEYAVDEYRVCDLYCDYWGCWEDCYYTYDEYCIDYVSDHDSYDDCECSSDYDCRRGEYCGSDGYCYERERDDPDTGELCDSCTSHADCGGQNDLCVVFGDDSRGYCGEACNADRDCPTDFECMRTESNSQCVPIDRVCRGGDDDDDGPSPIYDCESDWDCGSDEVCEGGNCVIEEPECEQTTDCAQNEMCMNGECVADDTESCTFNNDCAQDGLCIDGQCRDYCSDESDCGAEEVCRGGVCSPAPEPECTVGSDCGDGNFVCVDGMCRDGCSSTQDCDSGTECTAGFCNPVDVECNTTADCGDDQVCVSGSCFFTCRANCSCPEGMICDEDEGICTNAPAPDECEVDCDCPSGLICDSGTCVE